MELLREFEVVGEVEEHSPEVLEHGEVEVPVEVVGAGEVVVDEVLEVVLEDEEHEVDEELLEIQMRQKQ